MITDGFWEAGNIHESDLEGAFDSDLADQAGLV
jgi:hypothetical protein